MCTLWTVSFCVRLMSNRSVCIDLLTAGESLCHDGVSTHRPVLFPHLEAALTKIKELPQNSPPTGVNSSFDAYSSPSSGIAMGLAKCATHAISKSINCIHQNWQTLDPHLLTPSTQIWKIVSSTIYLAICCLRTPILWAIVLSSTLSRTAAKFGYVHVLS
jgi:hypothetical protein